MRGKREVENTNFDTENNIQNNKNNKKNKNILKILIALVVVVLIAGISVLVWYSNGLKPILDKDDTVRITIEKGSSVSVISENLQNKGVIKNALIMKLYCKLNNVSNLQAGKYNLNPAEDMPTIISHIVNGEIATDEIKITFIEGKTIKDFAKQIAKNTKNTEEDVFELLEDEEYLDSLIEKYWFITDEIKNEKIYYPLEGYLLPDTYSFESDEVSVETIFNVMLNYMEKLLEPYKETVTREFTVHQMLTLASMAEREAKTLEDRKEVVGVFMHRISIKMSLGSDVTTYYAFGVDMGERDLYKKELNTENPYNTRGPNMEGKIPIGPICNPSKEAIEATIEYTPTDNLYFVADKYGDVYFTKNDTEHVKMIQKLKDDGLWYTYD